MQFRWAKGEAFEEAEYTGKLDPNEVVKTKGDYPEDHDPVDGVCYYPVVNYRRVHGSTYKPYPQTTEWAESANQILWNEANRNFRNGRR